MEEKLKALVSQREAVQNKLERVKTSINNSEAVPNANLENVHFLQLKLKTTECCYGEFNCFQNQIYALPLTAKQRNQHEKAYIEFETMHNAMMIQLTEQVEQVVKNAGPVGPTNVVVSQCLPPLDVPLPTFDGSYETWFSFKCMFQNVMARYQSEAPVIKLYHLRNSLVGKAAGFIDQDIVNNNDYDAAWAILEDRFEDRRAIIDKHIDALLTLPKITRDNALELRNLIDSCVKNVEALKALELPVSELSEQMLVNLIAAKMDWDTRKDWETEQKFGVLPTYAATIAFLKKRFKILERIQPNGVKTQRSVTLAMNRALMCDVCGQQHHLMDCEQFMSASVNEKYNQLRKSGLCFSCLKKGHRRAECTSVNLCQLCGRKHHTTLHAKGANKLKPTASEPAVDAPNTKKDIGSLPPKQSTVFSTSSETPKKQVLLPTAVVLVNDSDGVPRLGRALVDSCSQSHFVTEKFANSLALRKKGVSNQVSGLNGGMVRIAHSVRTKMKSRVTSFSAELELLVSPKILDGVQPETFDVASWNIPPAISLADPKFNSFGDIDMLLGAEIFWDLIKADKIKLADNLPSLRNTELGWIVGGALEDRVSTATHAFTCVVKKGN